MELTGDPDGVVVRAVLAGDVNQYAVLVRRYSGRYARYAARLLGSVDDAEDAVQDAFVRAYDQLAHCREPDNFAGWFFLILRNRCFAHRRRSRRHGELNGAAELAAADDVEAPLELAERRQALQRALGSLTNEQREVFVLKHVEELSYEEIAEILGCSPGTVASRISRAHKALERRLSHLVKGVGRE